jgi:hypothetical protein
MTSQPLPGLTPQDFIGVWQRLSISVAGEEPAEDSHAYWLHAGGYFADIRWPAGDESQAKVSAFAGAAQWDSPVMRFHHEIDLTKEFSEDTGTMFFKNEELHEKGQVFWQGRNIEFEEVWAPLVRTTQSDCQVLRKLDKEHLGLIVRVGHYAMTLQETESEFCCAYWRDNTGTNQWSPLFELGDVDELTSVWLAIRSGAAHNSWQTIL